MDERIAELMGAGDEEGLKLLQNRYGSLVRYVVRGVLRDARDAEECVSDVYLQVWARIGQYDPSKGKLSTWLTTVARNTALNRLRGVKPGEESLDEGHGSSPSPEEEVLRRERQERLRSVIAGLSPGDRLLCYRKYYYLQSTAQMAAELGLTKRAVEGRLYRLREKLRRALGGEEP